MRALKDHIAGRFNTALLAGALIGLFMPGLDHLPDGAALVQIAAIIFFSCARINAADLKAIDKKAAAGFYVLRFLAFPVAAYAVALRVVPDSATGVLLLSLMPAAVASTAVAGITGANASLALAATVVTNALCPFVIPAVIGLTVGRSVDIDSARLLTTLCLGIFTPALLYYLGARRSSALKAWVKRESQFYAVLFSGGLVVVVIASRRDILLADPALALEPLLLGTALYAVMYAIGWVYAARMAVPDRRTYAICSGVNNIALCAAVAVLYFPPMTAVFVVLGEIPWIAGVALFKRWADGSARSSFDIT